MYKYWLVKQLKGLDIDIMNHINQHTIVIEPPDEIISNFNIILNHCVLTTNIVPCYDRGYRFEKAIIMV